MDYDTQTIHRELDALDRRIRPLWTAVDNMRARGVTPDPSTVKLLDQLTAKEARIEDRHPEAARSFRAFDWK